MCSLKRTHDSDPTSAIVKSDSDSDKIRTTSSTRSRSGPELFVRSPSLCFCLSLCACTSYAGLCFEGGLKPTPDDFDLNRLTSGVDSEIIGPITILRARQHLRKTRKRNTRYAQNKSQSGGERANKNHGVRVY